MGRKVWVPAVSGPLAGYAAGYGSWLRAQCYSRSAISDRLWQFDQLSRWLDREGPWCLMSMCSRNGVRVPHVVCSRNLGPQGDGFVLGGDDEGLLDPVDVPGQVRRIGLGVELL